MCIWNPSSPSARVVLGIFVERDRHQLTVDQLHQHGTARDDVVLVPAVDVHDASEQRRSPIVPTTLYLGPSTMRVTSPRRESTTCPSPVGARPRSSCTLPTIAFGEVHVRLISLEDPLADVRQLRAAILNAAVRAVHPEFDLQLEILDRAAAPDQEVVLLHDLFRRRFADDLAVFDAPELWCLRPTRSTSCRRRSKQSRCCRPAPSAGRHLRRDRSARGSPAAAPPAVARSTNISAPAHNDSNTDWMPSDNFIDPPYPRASPLGLPTRALARRFAGSLRSRGSLAAARSLTSVTA